MIDPFKENILTASEAAKHKALHINGKPPHKSKVYRMFDRGTKARDGRRVVLDSIKTPTGVCTSTEALARYFNELNGRNVTPSAAAISKQAAAENDLRRSGLM